MHEVRTKKDTQELDFHGFLLKKQKKISYQLYKSYKKRQNTKDSLFLSDI